MYLRAVCWKQILYRVVVNSLKFVYTSVLYSRVCWRCCFALKQPFTVVDCAACFVLLLGLSFGILV